MKTPQRKNYTRILLAMGGFAISLLAWDLSRWPASYFFKYRVTTVSALVIIKFKSVPPVSETILEPILKEFSKQEKFTIAKTNRYGGSVSFIFTQDGSIKKDRITISAHNSQSDRQFAVSFYADVTSNADYDLRRMQSIITPIVRRLKDVFSSAGFEIESMSRTE
jgi:hypothetical protein